MATKKKGKEPAGLRRYRLSRKKSGGKKRSTSRGVAKTTKKRKRATGTTALAGMVDVRKKGVINVGAAIAGAALAWNFRDDARIVKLIPNSKYRYLVLTGLAIAPPIVAGLLKKKLPEPLTFFCLGAGVAGGMAAVPVFFPKLLPAPMTGRANAAGMGRLSRGKLQELRDFIARGDRGMTGRRPEGVMLGTHRGTLMGRGRRGTLTGAAYSYRARFT